MHKDGKSMREGLVECISIVSGAFLTDIHRGVVVHIGHWESIVCLAKVVCVVAQWRLRTGVQGIPMVGQQLE